MYGLGMDNIPLQSFLGRSRIWPEEDSETNAHEFTSSKVRKT